MVSYDEIIKIIELDADISEKYKVNARSDFFEGSIVQSFGIDVINLKSASFFPPKQQRALLAEAYTDFQLGITPEQGEQLVYNINLEFPDSAEIVVKGNDKQHIAIKHAILVDPKFWEKIKMGLNYIAENYVDLFKSWQEESMKPNKKIVENLNWVASGYADDNPFKKAVLDLSAQVNHGPLLLGYEALKKSSDNLQKAVNKIPRPSGLKLQAFEDDIEVVNDNLIKLNHNLEKLNINKEVPLLRL